MFLRLILKNKNKMSIITKDYSSYQVGVYSSIEHFFYLIFI